MPTQYQKAKGERGSRTEQRYWFRTDSPRSWHPWGTTQLLCIALLFLFGAVLIAPGIEADVRTQVSGRLQDAGITAAATTADGQSVMIRAESTETTETAVQAIAASTRCRTWAGKLRCPTTVDVRLDVPVNAAATLSGEVLNSIERERNLGAPRKNQ